MCPIRRDTKKTRARFEMPNEESHDLRSHIKLGSQTVEESMTTTQMPLAIAGVGRQQGHACTASRLRATGDTGASSKTEHVYFGRVLECVPCNQAIYGDEMECVACGTFDAFDVFRAIRCERCDRQMEGTGDDDDDDDAVVGNVYVFQVLSKLRQHCSSNSFDWHKETYFHFQLPTYTWAIWANFVGEAVHTSDFNRRHIGHIKHVSNRKSNTRNAHIRSQLPAHIMHVDITRTPSTQIHTLSMCKYSDSN